MTNNEENFEKVIPTARMVAYRRTFSDIAYSTEIFEKLEEIKKRYNYTDIPEELKKPQLAPQFEARHKLIDKLIYQTHYDQILELASGFSSRGLSMAQENNFNYVELDLSKVIEEKMQIIKEISEARGFSVPNNLHFESGNVLDMQSFENAVKHFDKSKSLVITNEGLLRYLTKDEKAKVAKNIQQILEYFEGVRITSDISVKKIFNTENKIMNDHVKKISELTGKDIFSNRFETEAEAREFFENLGFSIQRHSFMEVYDDLVSPKNLNLTEEQTKETLEDAVVYIMKIKS